MMVFLQGASHHLADEFRFRDIFHFLRSHPLPVAKNRHAIRESEDFIEPVTDVDDCCAAGPEVANDSEKAFDVVLRKHGGGLVEDKYARLQGESLGNFHALAVSDGQAAGSDNSSLAAFRIRRTIRP
jgi:hypothetical protein